VQAGVEQWLLLLMESAPTGEKPGQKRELGEVERELQPGEAQLRCWLPWDRLLAEQKEEGDRRRQRGAAEREEPARTEEREVGQRREAGVAP